MRLGLGKAPLALLPEAALPALLLLPTQVTFLGLAESAAKQVATVPV